MHRLGVQGHALRYAWARERRAAYLADGIAMNEALARTSMDLGHGDGRGRWALGEDGVFALRPKDRPATVVGRRAVNIPDPFIPIPANLDKSLALLATH